MNRLIIKRDTWDRIKNHLLADDSEHLCFILAQHADTRRVNLFVEEELQLVPDEDLNNGAAMGGISLKLEALLRIMNRANMLRCVLVEAHSHPSAYGTVAFSPIDLDGQADMASYLADVAPGKAYGAIVLGRDAVKGQIWLPGRENPAPLNAVRVLGPVVQDLEANGMARPRPSSPSPDASDNPYHRQILALGEHGHRMIGRVTVAIVGLGGLGSIVAQELAHLGVKQFRLIDDDVVERTNLHRVVGTTIKSVGRAKVEVAKDQIISINHEAKVGALHVNLRSTEAFRALIESDVIFGCVDTDSGRLILNEAANAYLIPYIDCGVGIAVERGKVTEAGGRVIVWVPGRPCLLCANEVDARIAAEELESAEECELRRQHGYVAGANVPEPAVISLNGTVASLAVSEFQALVAGLKDSSHYTYYDLLEQRMGPRIVQKNPRCLACALMGRGDKADLDRYTRQGIPSDLPRV
jgi:molybdopterin/thiamine biosynthesis adenylyltransferase